MRKSTRRRPELEPLETMLLMSTVSAEAHHAAKAVAPAGPVQLSGTFQLKTEKFPAELGLIPASTGFVGSGNLGKFGRTQVIVEGAEGSSPFYIVGLKGGKGYLALGAQISIPTKGASTTAEFYAIDGNGGPIDNVNPTGTITISDVVSKGGKSSYVLKLS